MMGDWLAEQVPLARLQKSFTNCTLKVDTEAYGQ